MRAFHCISCVWYEGIAINVISLGSELLVASRWIRQIKTIWVLYPWLYRRVRSIYFKSILSRMLTWDFFIGNLLFGLFSKFQIFQKNSLAWSSINRSIYFKSILSRMLTWDFFVGNLLFGLFSKFQIFQKNSLAWSSINKQWSIHYRVILYRLCVGN